MARKKIESEEVKEEKEVKNTTRRRSRKENPTEKVEQAVNVTMDIAEETDAVQVPKIKIKKINIGAKLPQKAHESDACFDFFLPTPVICYPYSMSKIKTGIAMELPEGYHLALYMRSSWSKKSLRLSNCVGIVDNHYRGEIIAYFDNNSAQTVLIEDGERFLQGMLVKDIPVAFEQVEELSDSDRGDGGFGSTGK